MKAFPISFIILCFCATAALISAQEVEFDSTSGDAAKLRMLEFARFEAQKRKDNAALDALFDNSLISVDSDGTLLSKAELLAKLHGTDAQELEIIPEKMTVRMVEDTASVLGIYRRSGIRAGKAYLQRCRFIDTWVFKNGKWVCIATIATASIE